jgi:hypothetical protein
MILFDFVCKYAHVNEKLVSRETKQIDCPQCDEVATRVIPAVRCSLDPLLDIFQVQQISGFVPESRRWH